MARAAASLAQLEGFSIELVHPSLSPEPFGLAVAEAMACGKPVIVANHGGAREVVGSNQSGILFPPGNVDACFEAIRCILRDPVEAQRMGERGRARVEANFSLARFADQMAGIYDSLVPPAKAGHA
jgi:glycosyltransferase involved in cell wall biosynthesis